MMEKPILLKDKFCMTTELKTEEEKDYCRRNKIPMFRGVLTEVDDYGNEIFVGENTLVWSGALTTLEKVFGVSADFKPVTLNTVYGLNETLTPDISKTFVCLFGIGIGGAGLEFNTVKDPSFKQREIEEFIPMRVDSTMTITGTDADKYYFKRDLGNGKYASYLKEFQAPTRIKSQWKDSIDEDEDGTEISEEIFDSTKTNLVECFAECSIRVVAKDVRSYYESMGNIEHARYNSLGLFLGQKVEVAEGVYDYINVNLFSVLNFENVSVKDRAKFDYRYRIYSAY